MIFSRIDDQMSCKRGGSIYALMSRAQGCAGAATYRIAVGPYAGRKVFTLQTLPDCNEPFVDHVGKVAGFSLHAGVAARAHERKKLERLCRYIARPAVSEKRLSLLHNGKVRYELKTPYRDGTTHVIFEPLDFIVRLVALVPKPRVNLTQFHGVFAPNSAHRARVTPGKRGKGNKARTAHAPEDTTPAGRSRHPASRGISASMHVNAGLP